LFEQGFTVRMPLLTATIALGLWEDARVSSTVLPAPSPCRLYQ